MSDPWYYNIGGLEMGPVTFDELLDLARAEQVAADDEIKLGVDGKWRRAGSIGRLMAVLPFQAAKAKPVAKKIEPEVVETDASDPFAALEDADSAHVSVSQESLQNQQAPVVDPQIEYQVAFAKAKENIFGAMIAQAEAAFQAAEAQAKQEVAWASAANVDKQWWGWMGNVEFGPVEFPQVLALARNGQIKPSDFIRNGQFGQFVPASNVPGLLNAVAILAKASDALALAKSQAKAAVELAVPVPTVSNLPSPARLTPPNGIAIPREESKNVVPVLKSEPKNRGTHVPRSEESRKESREERPAIRRVTPATEIPVHTAPAAIPRNPEPDTDTDILGRVREALDSRNVPGFTRLELFINSGVVIVRGSLSSEGERLLAIRAVEQTDGVVRVDDMLTVTGTPTQARTASRSAPVIAAAKKNRPSGPGLISRLLERVKGDYRNHAIGTLVATALLGFWFYPRGPVRPVAVFPVKGRLMMNGQPLANAAIVLHSTSKSKTSKMPAYLHPHAKAEADGSFTLATFDKADGAPEGEFVATVFLTEEIMVDGEKQGGPNKLPELYAKPETSPFRVKITSSTKELQPLELTMQ